MRDDDGADGPDGVPPNRPESLGAATAAPLASHPTAAEPTEDAAPHEVPGGEPDLHGDVGRDEAVERDPAADVKESVDEAPTGTPIEQDVELVIGITRAMGTPVSVAMEQLANSLSNYGYEVYQMRISELIQDSLVAQDRWPATAPPPHERYEILIDHGNELCKEAKRLDELALRAVDSIQEHRKSLLQPAIDHAPGDQPSTTTLVTPIPVDADHTKGETTGDAQEAGPDGSAATTQSPAGESTSDTTHPAPASAAGGGFLPDGSEQFLQSRRVYIVDSLKRIQEVTRLRRIYGDHFLLIGFQASESLRLQHLTAKFETQGAVSHSEAAQKAQELMDKDGAQPVEFGQELLRTFPMADVFIDVEKNGKARAQVVRTIELLFGDPAASGPTDAEFGMQLATQTQTRSPELGLRVGAVILGRQGDVLATGTNQHPTEKGSPSHDAGAMDLRHLVADTLKRMADEDDLLSVAAQKRARASSEEFADELLAGPLKDGELKALIEYQRPVHAEMNALVSALRQRATLDGATIYVTAYPCHICAKHLIAVGLKVVYLSPYAKSKATAMYGKEARNWKPFTGVAPRRYEEFFIGARAADRKDEHGERQEWDGARKRIETPKVTPQISMGSKQKREDLGRV